MNQSSPAISITCSPSLSTSPRLTGKPLAMLWQSMPGEQESESADSEEDEDTPPPSPSTQTECEQEEQDGQPLQPLVEDHTDNAERANEEGKAPPQHLPEVQIMKQKPLNIHINGKMLVTLVERKTSRYFSDNVCIKQTDITDTYPVLVPAEWDKSVPCNYGLKQK